MQKLLSLLTIVTLIMLRPAATVSAQSAEIVGTWEMTTNSPEGTRSNMMIVTKDSAAFKAVAKSERGERAYDSVQVEGTKVTIVLTIDYQGTAMVITYTGRMDKGKWKAMPTSAVLPRGHGRPCESNRLGDGVYKRPR